MALAAAETQFRQAAKPVEEQYWDNLATADDAYADESADVARSSFWVTEAVGCADRGRPR